MKSFDVIARLLTNPPLQNQGISGRLLGFDVIARLLTNPPWRLRGFFQDTGYRVSGGVKL